MANEGRTWTQRLHAALLVGACALALASCVTSQTASPQSTADLSPPDVHDSFGQDVAGQDLDRFQYDAARNTVRSGLKGIAQRYIEPVDQSNLALQGLKGLASIDPALSVSVHEGFVVLKGDDGLIAQYPHPIDDGAAEWADLTTSLIRDARRASPDMAQADNERVYEALFDGMLSHLDIFSRYAGAEEARANRARRDGFGGIGIRFAKLADGIVITHVQDDSPAQNVGLRPGDMIKKINFTATDGLSLRFIAGLLRGPVGSGLTLAVQRVNSEPRLPERQISFALTRAHIVPETVQAQVRNDILQMRITSFNKQTAQHVRKILRTHAAAFESHRLKGVVLDVRDNPGGLLSQSVDVADLFLSKGRITATRGRHPDSFHDYNAGGIDMTSGAPMAVLVDGNSASAAEIVASALQDLGRAVVVGATSYGKGTVQTVMRLPNDGEITLTWSRLISPSGYALHGLGVFPVVCATSEKGSPDTATLLNADHIDAQRNTVEAWHATGTIFDDRRGALRRICPTQALDPGKNDELLLLLANHLIHDPELYRHAVQLSEPVSTAYRN